MVNNYFPKIHHVEYLNKQDKTGFTDGKTIYLNFYTGIFMSFDAIETINTVYLHELIHTIDMNISENQVLYITKVVLDNLRKNQL